MHIVRGRVALALPINDLIWLVVVVVVVLMVLSCVLSERRYVHTAVVPGMALYLNCTAGAACRHTSANVDVMWMYSHSGNTSSWRPVNLLTDDNYVGSRDGGLVILRVNSSQHTGTFYCTDSVQRIVVEHDVTTSGQSHTTHTHRRQPSCTAHHVWIVHLVFDQFMIISGDLECHLTCLFRTHYLRKSTYIILGYLSLLFDCWKSTELSSYNRQRFWSRGFRKKRKRMVPTS